MQERKETRICYHCLKPGHLIAEGRSKAAGKPKAPRPVGAASIKPEGLEEDCRSLTEDCGVMDEENREDQLSDGEDG